MANVRMPGERSGDDEEILEHNEKSAAYHLRTFIEGFIVMPNEYQEAQIKAYLTKYRDTWIKRRAHLLNTPKKE